MKRLATLSMALKLGLLGIALLMSWATIKLGIGGAIGGAAAMAGGAGMLLAKGLRTPLSTIEATICVAFAVGFSGGSLPFLIGTCAPGPALGIWGGATVLAALAATITFRHWPPGQVLNPVRGMTVGCLVLGLGFFGFTVFEFTRLSCEEFSFFPGLAASLIPLFAIFALNQGKQ